MKTMRFLLFSIISLIIYTPSANAQLEFVQHVVASDFTNGFDVIAEDLDQDGHPDIIGCAKTSVGEVSWWKNDGANEFDKIVIKQGFQGARSVRAKDMDDDQDIDLVSAAWQANTIIYFENDGNENFTEYVVDDDFKGAHTVDLKDVNHDGSIDILCSGFDYYGHEGEIAWWENDGLTPIGWTKHLISDRFQQSPFIYGEDMDNDEDLDVIACGELNDEILWWENNGSGDFIGEYMIDSLFDAAHTVIARDVDLDGDMDILGAACLSSSIAWYENDGSQQFLKHPLPQFGGALWLDAIDVDNDDDLDLFGAGMAENRLAWWENNGSQFFAKHYIDNTFTQGFSIVPVLMDNDNDVDFVAIGYASDKISWFENKLVDPIVYNHPECCVYDYEQNKWFISNTGGVDNPGNIVEINEEGIAIYWLDNLIDPLGMCIADGILYVSEANNGVYGFDLDNGQEVFFQAFSPIGNVDGQTYDNDGHLFIVDTGGKIYKIYLSNQTMTEFVSSGLTSWTQDIVFDETNNRLLAIGYGNNAPIQAISLEDSTITNYPTDFSYYDGITIDQFGNVYLASHQSPGRIVKYKNNLSGDYDIVSSGHDEPAGLHYNIETNILAVPNYGGSTVDFIYAGGNLINVPEDEPTIQAAINIALNGDTIIVAPGTYTENINFLGKNIVLASQFIIDKNFTHIQNTIIDGSSPANPDTACCVRFVSGEESSAALIGFTICNGTGTQWVDPQIPSWTWHSGGGIFIFQSSPTIKCNIITNNHVNDPMGADGASGGGLCTFGGNPIIQNNIIKNNTALYGAGVVIDYSGCIFRNNIVTGNSGGQSYGGGAFWTIGNGADPILIENNTIVNNEVFDSGLGGAMYVWSTNLTAVNNILWGNIQPTGDPIYLTGTSSVDITFSNVEGDYAGEGNINQPPLFADTNFLLLQNSPCIDAGNPVPTYNDNENPTNPNNALWPSFESLVNDMGVYGGQNCIFLGNTPVGFQENFRKNDQTIFEVNCFPNPFQEYVNFNITADKKSDIEIKIFSIDGKLIKCINKRLNSESDKNITWDGIKNSGKVIANGMYFIKMSANDKLFTQKIIKQ